MGEVDQLDDPVDHGVAQRDQGEDGPVGQAQDQLVGKEPHPFSWPPGAAIGRLPNSVASRPVGFKDEGQGAVPYPS